MKRFAFALIPEKGHINPYVGPAQALQGMGDEVVIAAPGDIGAQMERAGLTFQRDLIPTIPETRVTSGAALVELIQNAAALDTWIEQLLLDPIDAGVPAVERWFDRVKPDAVVVDPLYYAAAIAADRAGIPWASVSNSLNPVIPPDLDSALLRTLRRLAPRRDALFSRHGCRAEFRGADVLSRHLTIAFASEAFVGPPPPGVVLVGPSFPLGARGDEVDLRPLPEGRPIVYASFGSQIYHWPRIFDKLYDAAMQVHAHAVFSVGDLPFDRPGCDAYRYAPQLEILRHAAVFCTHGGANSVMESLAAGVPMIVSPMCNDQFHQAYFVSRSGTGVVLDLVKATCGQIVEALAVLLAAGRFPGDGRNGAMLAAEHIAGLVP